MLKFLLAYQVVIDHITADKCLKLRRYELEVDNDDWAIVEDLVSILEVHMLVSFYIHRLLMHFNVQRYKNATLFFSQDSASIAAVIPAMDKLDAHLKPGT